MKDRDEFPMLIVANKADLEKNRQVTTIYLQQTTNFELPILKNGKISLFLLYWVN